MTDEEHAQLAELLVAALRDPFDRFEYQDLVRVAIRSEGVDSDRLTELLHSMREQFDLQIPSDAERHEFFSAL